jgi:hypothetical protein
MSDEDNVVNITPKGWFIDRMRDLGVKFPDAEDVWCSLEGFCARQLPDGDSAYPCLVFDGAGGEVIPVFIRPSCQQFDDDEDFECDYPICSGEASDEDLDDEFDDDVDSEWFDDEEEVGF